MTDEAILKLMKKTMAEVLLVNNERLMISVEKSIEKAVRASEERLTKKLTQKIEDSQKDTIDTLTALIHTGYNLHEERIQRIENELSLPPLKQKH